VGGSDTSIVWAELDDVRHCLRVNPAFGATGLLTTVESVHVGTYKRITCDKAIKSGGGVVKTTRGTSDDRHKLSVRRCREGKVPLGFATGLATRRSQAPWPMQLEMK
jgi:hypothetical protein